MEAFLVLLFIALIAGARLRLHARPQGAGGAGPAGRRPGCPQAPAPEPIGGADVRALKVGDVVNHESRDYIVEGTLRFNQGGFRWDEHRLVDGARLAVAVGRGRRGAGDHRLGAPARRGAGARARASSSTPACRFELDERGRANFTSEGVTGAPGGGKAEFADYTSGQRRLSFERYGGDGGWEISVGSVISEHALDVYPSRGASE